MNVGGDNHVNMARDDPVAAFQGLRMLLEQLLELTSIHTYRLTAHCNYPASFQYILYYVIIYKVSAVCVAFSFFCV
jgi:hypothetical protein